MADLPLYTALKLSNVPSSPSANRLQWTSDGQAYLMTKTALHLFTPEPGLTFKASSVLTSSIRADKTRPLGWYRSMIEFTNNLKDDSNQNPETPIHWPDISHEFSAVTLGSMDVSLRSVACSPSNLTRDAGCVIAILNSNLEISLWNASKNYLNGEWIRAYNISAVLVGLMRSEINSITAAVLQAQIISVAWSKQADFGILPTPGIDGSLLVMGNRAGSLIFMRHRPTGDRMRFLHCMTITNKWITHLAWSSWNCFQPGQCEALLAYSTSDGQVGLVKVQESLQERWMDTDHEEPIKLRAEVVDTGSQSLVTDNRGITALAFVEPPGRKPILVIAKPGVIYLFASSISTLPGWTGAHLLPLQTQRNSAGSSALHPVCGIQYINNLDAVIIGLYDGSLHTIYNLSVEPYLSRPQGENVEASHTSSQALSTLVRSIFFQTEPEYTRFTDVNRTSGFISYDGSSTMMWAHEPWSPVDLEYKPDAKHYVKLIVAQLWPDDDDLAEVKAFARILQSSKAADGVVPMSLLRPLFLRLNKLRKIRADVLGIIRVDSMTDKESVTVPPWTGPLGQGVRATFRSSLWRNLFGWDSFLTIRMRLSIADFLWKYSEDDIERGECGVIAQNLLDAIQHRVLRTLIRHLAAATSLISSKEMPFVLRILARCAPVSGCPPDLSAEGQELRTALHAIHPEACSVGSNETCPACQVEVPLNEVAKAQCKNGHVWSRCSITSFVLSTAMVRTCVGCGRKAFLPPSMREEYPKSSNWLPTAAQSWIVEELLEAVNRCLFCGNNFVRLL